MPHGWTFEARGVYRHDVPTSPDIVRFDALTAEQADRVVEHLVGYLSESRRERVEIALAARTRDVVVVLEDIYNEHNASAVLRTSEAFGVLEVHTVPRTRQFRLSRKVSLGSHRWVDLRRHGSSETAYAALRERGYRIWAADVHGDPVPLSEVPADEPIALVFGNELEGLTRQAVEAADGIFKVPMTGFVESLNISVAAAVSVYDVLERRRALGRLQGLGPEELRQIRAAWYAMSVRAAPELLARAGLPCPVMVLEGE